jgi:histidine ammonia-lyase
MNSMLPLDGLPLTLEQIAAVASGSIQVSLAPGARARMAESREVIERIVADGAVVYGVSTGFGKLADVHIPREQLKDLQLNLVRSHASGVGNPLSEVETRAMMLLRANVLALGLSGCRIEVVEALAAMLDHGVTPVVPERGSVGASGDLAPLAHLALSLIGEGECFYRHERMATEQAMRLSGLKPLHLEAKEGLALLNGTQAMGAVGGLATYRAGRLVQLADVAGAMSLEALKGTPVAFDERIQEARPHPGQIAAASHLRALLQGSEIRASHLNDDPRVQDAYSLRCMPQVHGAVRGVIKHVRDIVEIESAAATDNPLVVRGGEVLSGGNFHGAPLAMAFDYLAIAATDLASISERRIDRLINPDLNEGLPPFLTTHAGMESGFMIPHVTAVALLNECKVYSHPASVDNVPTSGGKEDHVSMGMTAALKLRNVVDNLEMVLAIELLAGAQALEFRKPLKPGRGVSKAYDIVRSVSPALVKDRSLARDIELLAAAIRRGDFDELEKS